MNTVITNHLLKGNLFLAFLLISIFGTAQTDVGGTLTSDTHWTTDGSPYSITSTLGVPSGITLTIDAGVEVTGNFDLLVKGSIIAEGTDTDSIKFNLIRLMFKSTNLSNSKVSHIQFTNGGIQLADESEHNQDAVKNSGILTAKKCWFGPNSYSRTKGYETNALLVLDSCNLESSTVYGYYPLSEKIELKHSSINYSNITSDSYNKGIFLYYSEVDHTKFKIGCCNANINVYGCTISSSSFEDFNDYYYVNIDSSIVTDTYISLEQGSLNIKNSHLRINSTIPKANHIAAKKVNLETCTFEGNGSTNALSIIDYDSYSSNKSTIDSCNFINYKNGIFIGKIYSLTVTQTNFLNIDSLALTNNSNKNITAQENYWGVSSESQIADVIYDGYDDINYGFVDYSNFLTSPTSDAPMTKPDSVYKGSVDGGVLISWTANKEENLAGYKVYSSTDGTNYSLIKDVGDTINFIDESGEIDNKYVVAAYSDAADGINDELEGNLSQKSDPAELFLKNLFISKTNICRGDSIEINVNSTYPFSQNDIIIEVSDKKKSFVQHLVLDTISANLTKNLYLPDSLAAETTYSLRVYVPRLGVFSDSSDLTIHEIPGAHFSISPSHLCFGDTAVISFQSEKYVETTFDWMLSGGEVTDSLDDNSAKVLWTTSGKKQVSLSTSRYGCISDTQLDSIVINNHLISSFTSSDIVCENDSARLVYLGNTYEGITYEWKLDEGTIISDNDSTILDVEWQDFGTKSVQLQVNQNGCSSDITQKNIEYTEKPKPSFELASFSCYGDTITVNYTGVESNTASYNWDFDGARVVSGSESGPYNISWSVYGDKKVQLQVSDKGCTSGPVTNSISVNPRLDASFKTVAAICEGQNALLQFQGAAPVGSSYSWRLDNGQVISANDTTEVEVSWDTFGSKNISLQISLNGCSSQLVEKQIDYLEEPDPSFQVSTEGCQNEEINVQYLGELSKTTQIEWAFDGAEIIENNNDSLFTLQWNNFGTKNITLKVHNGICSNSSVQPIEIKKKPTSKFSVNSTLCEGDTATIEYLGNAADTAKFVWDFAGGTIVSEEDESPLKVIWDSFGLKKITLQIEENGCSSNQYLDSLHYYAHPTLSFDQQATACQNQDFNITYIGQNTDSVFWDFGTASVLAGSATGPYTLSWDTSGSQPINFTASNPGCLADTTLSVDVNPALQTPNICIVTVDSISGKNKVIWNIDPTYVNSINLYRETNVAGEYAIVQNISPESDNYFIDPQSDPEQVSNRYKISVIDHCDTETSLSDYHKTIHLTINKGNNNVWNLIWDSYEGLSFGTYRIYRFKGKERHLLTEVASNITSYTDNDPPSANVSYQIEIVNSNPCDIQENGRKNEVLLSQSNIVSSEVITSAIRTIDASIYPNPTTGMLNIKSGTKGKYQIFDLLGNEILQGQLKNNTQIDLTTIHSGIYFIKIENESGMYTEKIVKH